MTLHISYDHQVFTWQTYGGISRYYYEIANRIAAMGNEVEVFAPFYVNEYFRNSCQVRPQGVKIPFLWNIAPQILKIINPSLAYLLLKPRKNIDVLHETYYSLIDWCPKSTKRVLTVYDMIHEKFTNYFSKWNKTQQFKAHAVHRADHVICISENTRRDLISLLNVPEEKTSVVYLGYSLSNDKFYAKTVMEDKPFILYVGARGGWKNFNGLIRAYGCSRFLKDECDLVCFGGGGFNTRELELMESLNIERSKIKHMSGPDKLLADLYSTAAAFVCPSLYEGFGIPPLEAMSFGCPVVCSNTSSLPEVVGDAAELFDPENETAMRCAIETVVSDPEKCQSLVERGYERIKQFSWEKCAHETFNVYNKILGMK
jgi:glycosyltransferase involved in cell wall biosynthesis